jgi:SAM-dependent methyltransferase
MAPAAAALEDGDPRRQDTPPTENDTRKRKRRVKQWFEEIFDEDYLRTLPFMTPRQTQREAEFILSSILSQDVSKSGQGGAAAPSAAAGPSPQRVLDLGCGYGRHALELAARGHKLTGLDLSLPLLIRAADEAQRRGLQIDFIHGDMRELTFDGQFDAAYCVFTTFGYFDDETNRRVTQSIARALKPGGRLLIEVLNRDHIVNDLPTRIWWEGDGCVVLEEVDFNYFTSRLMSRRSIVFDDGRQVEQDISIRAYSLHELGKMLHHADFRVIEVSGSLSTRARFFGGASPQILILAERRTG